MVYLAIGVAIYVGLGVLCFSMLRQCSRASRMEERDRAAAELELAVRQKPTLADPIATESPVLDRAEKRLAPWYDETNFFI